MPKRLSDNPNEPAIFRRQVSIVLRAAYPGCTEHNRGLMLKRFSRKPYRGRLLSVVAGLVESWIRHNQTLYERLLYTRADLALSRNDARQVVAGRVAATIARWREGSALEDPSFKALRERLHRRRLETGPSLTLTEEENAAIVDALTCWLRDRGQVVRARSPFRHPEGQSTSRAQEDALRPAENLMATEQPLDTIEQEADTASTSPEGAAPAMDEAPSPAG